MATKTCECGCDRTFEIDDECRPGRPRRYYEPACRKRAERNRSENATWIRAYEGELHVQSDPPTVQITTAVMETSAIAAAFRRLAIEEPNPKLAAGCEGMYLAILEALNRNFPGWSA